VYKVRKKVKSYNLIVFTVLDKVKRDVA